MKKILIALLLTLLSLTVFAQSGVVRELSGTVELKSPGASSYIAAKIGDAVSQDTVISTGFKSTALIEVGSALIAVRPLTRLTLTEIRSSSGNETLNVNLQAGRVRVDLNPPAGTKAAMAVTSPSATASVRGTSFDFDGRNLWVSNGIVGFKGNRGNTFMVSAGSRSGVEYSGAASDPIGSKNRGFHPPAPIGGRSDTGGGNNANANGGTGSSEPNFPTPSTPPPPKPVEPTPQPPSPPPPRPRPPGNNGGNTNNDVDIGISIDYS